VPTASFPDQVVHVMWNRNAVESPDSAQPKPPHAGSCSSVPLRDCAAARKVSAPVGAAARLGEEAGVLGGAVGPVTVVEVLGVLGTNGLFILTGVPGQRGPVGVDIDRIMRDLVLKNQCVLGTVNAGKDAFQRAVSDLTSFKAAWPDAVRSLITVRFPLERFAEPIQVQTGIKNIIEIST